MLVHLTYPTYLDYDEVVWGDLMPPNSPASLLTYERAAAGKLALEVSQAAKKKSNIEDTIIAWIVAHHGHNLTVTGRMLIPFHRTPPRMTNVLPEDRLYDGVIAADGLGGVTLYDPYRSCQYPDMGDMAAIMPVLWGFVYEASRPIDKAVAEDIVTRGARHCIAIESKRSLAFRSRQSNRKAPR